MNWWLSFADPERPAGSQFLGVCIAEGATELIAIQNAWRHGCNPGGEILAMQIPPQLPVDPAFRYRLFDRAELEKMGWDPRMLDELSPDEEAGLDTLRADEEG